MDEEPLIHEPLIDTYSEILAATPVRTRKLSRRYIYGWARANRHDVLAYIVGGKHGREIIRTLHQIERQR